MADAETLLHGLKEAGLERKAEALVALGRDAYQIRRRVVDESDLPLGTSHFGGSPDVPADFTWPSGKEGSFEFIAQINLADLPNPYALPSSGLLSFFGRLDEGRAFYFSDAGRLQHMASPHAGVERGFKGWLKRELRRDTGAHVYSTCRPEFLPTLSLPNLNSELVEALALTDKEGDSYDEFMTRLWPKETPHHQLLGNPELVQHDMEMECEFFRRGFAWKDGNPWQHPLRKEFEAGAREWRLLLQVDTDEDAGMLMWGDLGRVYFWIRREDLAQRAFDQSRMAIQFT